MDQHHDLDQLLARVSPQPEDAQRLVRAGISRGRALRRRQQAGTAVAALAVFGVIGAGAAVVPQLASGSPDRGASVAADPTPTPTQASTPTTAPSTSSSTSPSTSPSTSSSTQQQPTRITVTAQRVPDTVERILGRQGAGALRTAEGTASSPDELVAHFDWQGTLTSVVIEEERPGSRQQCQSGGVTCTRTPDGDLQLSWGPNEGDGVTAQGVTVWRRGFEISTLSYNAADGKDVAPLMAAPPLSKDDLARLASSDVWFD